MPSVTVGFPSLDYPFFETCYAAAAAAGPAELLGSARFDAIHLGASVEAVPQQFIDLLKPGGRLVLPLGAMHGAASQVNRRSSAYS
jgi:protein-L-isoaspartate O-methyltransferase